MTYLRIRHANKKPIIDRITPRCKNKLLSASQPAEGVNCMMALIKTRTRPIRGSNPLRLAKYSEILSNAELILRNIITIPDMAHIGREYGPEACRE